MGRRAFYSLRHPSPPTRSGLCAFESRGSRGFPGEDVHRFLSSDRPFEQQPTWKTETRLSVCTVCSFRSFPLWIPSLPISFGPALPRSKSVSLASTTIPLLVPPVITPPPRMSSCGNRFIRLCSRERRGICTSRQVENVNTRVLDSWTADIKLSDQWNICNDGRREKELFAKFVVASRMVDRFLFEFGCDARCVLFYFPPLFNDNVQISKENFLNWQVLSI